MCKGRPTVTDGEVGYKIYHNQVEIEKLGEQVMWKLRTLTSGIILQRNTLQIKVFIEQNLPT